MALTLPPTTETKPPSLNVGHLVRLLDAAVRMPGHDTEAVEALAEQLQELMTHRAAGTAVVVLPMDEAAQALQAVNTLARMG